MSEQLQKLKRTMEAQEILTEGGPHTRPDKVPVSGVAWLLKMVFYDPLMTHLGVNLNTQENVDRIYTAEVKRVNALVMEKLGINFECQSLFDSQVTWEKIAELSKFLNEEIAIIIAKEVANEGK